MKKGLTIICGIFAILNLGGALFNKLVNKADPSTFAVLMTIVLVIQFYAGRKDLD